MTTEAAVGAMWPPAMDLRQPLEAGRGRSRLSWSLWREHSPAITLTLVTQDPCWTSDLQN